MPKVLKYFDIGGLAEAVRYILHYTDQKFEDVRYELKSWPVKEVKDALPFGQLPLFVDGNRALNQSIAIARYVAANTDLLPSDVWKQAELDAIVFTIYDFHKHVVSVIYGKTPEEKEEMKNKLLNEHLDFFSLDLRRFSKTTMDILVAKFEKILKDNNGYFGGKLSWADFIFVGILESGNLFIETELQKGYPYITKLVEKIQGLPRVKEYIKGRKPYVKP